MNKQATLDTTINQIFDNEIEGCDFAETWLKNHKIRLGDWGSSFECFIFNNVGDCKLYVYWFKGEVAGNVSVLRDEFDRTVVSGVMFK